MMIYEILRSSRLFVRVKYRIDNEQVVDRCAVLQLNAISCNEMYGKVKSCYVISYHPVVCGISDRVTCLCPRKVAVMLSKYRST